MTDLPSDLIERVAKALYETAPHGVWNNRVEPMVFEPYAWDDGSLEEDEREYYRDKARAALTEAGAWIAEPRPQPEVSRATLKAIDTQKTFREGS